LLTVNNRSRVDDKVLRAFLPTVVQGRPLRQDSLERAGGNVSLDNFGNRFSGAWRAGTQLKLNSPLRLGDALSLRASASDAQFRYAGWPTSCPSAAAYNWAARGAADIASVYALSPLRRSRLANLPLQANVERKQLDDRSDSTGSMASKSIKLITLGISGDDHDSTGGGAITAWSLSCAGRMVRLDPATRAIDASGHRTEGRYDRLSLQLSRQQLGKFANQKIGTQNVVYKNSLGGRDAANYTLSEKGGTTTAEITE
jgi:hemolysin activation/secretion protein